MLSLLAPSRPARAVREAREAPALHSPALAQTSRIAGVSDDDAPALAAQRTAYRGLIALASRLRAGRVAQAMAGAAVEREVGPDEFEPVEPAHPWARLLREPSPHYSRRHLWYWAQQAKDLGRGAFLVVERDGAGRPLHLHPVFPAFGTMAPVGGPSGEVEGYVFTRTDGRRQRFDARDVVWVRHPHPVSPYESASLLEITAYESDTDLYQRVYLRDLLKRGGGPRLQVTTDQELTQADAREAEAIVSAKVWNQERTGVVPVFGRGASLQTVGLSTKDMEFVEGAGLNRRDLLQIWGVPEGLLSDRANRANADAAQYIFADLTVQPEADDNADQLTVQLRAAFDGVDRRTPTVSALVVRAPDVVPLDPDFVLRQDEMHLRTGQRAVNELRERDGLDGFDGGDEPLVSAALVPLAQAVAEPAPVVAPITAAPDVPAAEDDGGQRGWRADDDDPLAAEWAFVDRRKREAERPFAAVAAAYVRRVAREVSERVVEVMGEGRHGGERRAPSPAEAEMVGVQVFDLERWLGTLEDEFGPALVRVLRAGFETGALRLDALGVDGDLVFDADADAVQRALRQAVQNARSVPRTLRDEVVRALAEGMGADEDVAALARRVRDRLEGVADWKALQIAQTTGTGAFEASQMEAYRQAGVDRVRWMSQRDGRVRETHRVGTGVDGEEARLGTAFSNGCRFPGDPEGPLREVVNCRCTSLAVIDPGPRAHGRPDRIERDRQIQARFEEVKDDYASRGACFQALADEFTDAGTPVSARTVERAVWGR